MNGAPRRPRLSAIPMAWRVFSKGCQKGGVGARRKGRRGRRGVRAVLTPSRVGTAGDPLSLLLGKRERGSDLNLDRCGVRTGSPPRLLRLPFLLDPTPPLQTPSLPWAKVGPRLPRSSVSREVSPAPSKPRRGGHNVAQGNALGRATRGAIHGGAPTRETPSAPRSTRCPTKDRTVIREQALTPWPNASLHRESVPHTKLRSGEEPGISTSPGGEVGFGAGRRASPPGTEGASRPPRGAHRLVRCPPQTPRARPARDLRRPGRAPHQGVGSPPRTRNRSSPKCGIVLPGAQVEVASGAGAGTRRLLVLDLCCCHSPAAFERFEQAPYPRPGA
jgi:hypothetical protein